MVKISKNKRIAMRELRRKVSEKTAEKEAEAYNARSWHWEDMYTHHCCKCGKEFFGDKSRYICKTCYDGEK